MELDDVAITHSGQRLTRLIGDATANGPATGKRDHQRPAARLELDLRRRDIALGKHTHARRRLRQFERELSNLRLEAVFVHLLIAGDDELPNSPARRAVDY